MHGFRIRKLPNIPTVECFVSKYTNSAGNDNWYTVGGIYGDVVWPRDGWEMVVFADPTKSQRRGWYLNCTEGMLELTFAGFTEDLGIVRVDASK